MTAENAPRANASEDRGRPVARAPCTFVSPTVLGDDLAGAASLAPARLRRRRGDVHEDAAGPRLEPRARRAAEQLLGDADPAAAVHDRVAVVRADAAVADLHDAVGDGGRLGIVADDERRHAGLARRARG